MVKPKKEERLSVFVEKLYDQLAKYETLANDALRTGDMDEHMSYGRTYHRLADEIFRLTGVDPRPYAEVFHTSQRKGDIVEMEDGASIGY